MAITVEDFNGEYLGPKGCPTCGHLSCVCRIKKNHSKDCKFRLATTCAVGIECEHGRDVCPICDPCTCN